MDDINLCTRQRQCPIVAVLMDEKLRYRAELRQEREKRASVSEAFKRYYLAGCAMRNAQRAFKERRTEELRLVAVRATEEFDNAERVIMESGKKGIL